MDNKRSSLQRYAAVCILLILQCICLSPAALSDKAPDLPVKSAILMNAQTEEILYSKNPKHIQAPASLVKIMTLYLVFDAIDSGQISLHQQYRVSKAVSNIGGSQVFLKEGEKITVHELILSTAISSANDAASALAEIVGASREAFVKMMNQKAVELGLVDTVFRSANGLPKKNPDQTTAADIAKLAFITIHKHPEILKYTTQRISHIRNNSFQLVNTNKLAGKYRGLNGLKTGFTQAAGYCLVATATREDISLISVVLGANTRKERFQHTATLLDYGFQQFKTVHIEAKNKVLFIPVPNGKKQWIYGICKNDLDFTVNKDEEALLELETYIPNSVQAPIHKGQKVAEFCATLNGQVLFSTDVLAREDLNQAGVFRRFFRRFSR
ncbi:MAG: D-alanyl-D-alanine carboxypeptidase family protein [Chlamydiota bacterium]|nr:D-alanyl-D-alanine carboxypeptidase family protein [Chlamydiota bacterium]